MLDTVVKLFKKSKAMVVGRLLPMSTKPFTGTFSLRKKKMPLAVLILIGCET